MPNLQHDRADGRVGRRASNVTGRLSRTFTMTESPDKIIQPIPLAGGHDSPAVTRLGNTVLRPARAWTPGVHALLRHLETVGFAGAPRVLGVDHDGQEVLTYIEGSDGRAARCYDDEALAAVARMTRSYHDAVATFTPPPGSSWRPNRHAPPGTLVCHGDLSPANTIYRDGQPRAFIDWDFAAPSTALWDLSYAVRTFVPLYSPRDCADMGYPPGRQNDRLRIFCEAYGMSSQLRHQLLPAVRARLETETSDFAQRCRHTLNDNWDAWLNAAR
jgi:hypothetical protein